MAPLQTARFEGQRGSLVRLLLRNLLFSILTLGIYRFWGRTHVRRYVWRHTVVLDDALEYLGTGGELLIGFLVAVAVLLPMLGVFYVLQFLYADESDYALTLLEVLYYLALFFLVQLAIHRMRRYRLTRTAWRGIRFGLGGSSLRYACIAFGYGLLTAATLGLAYPWMRVATFRYFVRHARFGGAALTLSASARPLFSYWISIYGIVAVFAAILVFGSWEALQWFFEQGYYHGFGSGAEFDGEPVGLQTIMLASGFFIVCVVRYKVAEFRHLISNMRIGDSGFISRFRAEDSIKIYSIYFLVIFCALLSAVLLIIASWGLEVGNRTNEAPLVNALISLAAIIFLTCLAAKFSKTRWNYRTGQKNLQFFGRASGFLFSAGLTILPLMFYLSNVADYMDEINLKATSISNILALAVIVLFLLFRNFARTLILHLPLLKHACETLEIRNAGALDEVAQSSAAVPSYGEGTAEALDVGGF